MEIGDKVTLKCRVYSISKSKDGHTIRLTTESRWNDVLGLGGKFIDVDLFDLEVASEVKV